MKQIPRYQLNDDYRLQHRIEGETLPFGYNTLPPALRIPDFELYSSEGLKSSIGPLRSEFYRIGLTLQGTCDVQLGLELFHHQRGTVNCTSLNQLFSKSNISSDIFGYYLLFNPVFMESLLPANRIPEEFPFFSYTGTSFFQLSSEELAQIEGHTLRINEELQTDRADKVTAIRLYLYLILLELRRSYTRQQLDTYSGMTENSMLVHKFKKLVHQHYLTLQKVTDYAGLLHVTPNHLNRTVKEVSGRTASDHIAEMIAQEAKVLLRHTDLSVSEIAFRLQFSESSSFNRFFKKESGRTPLEFRANA